MLQRNKNSKIGCFGFRKVNLVFSYPVYSVQKFKFKIKKRPKLPHTVEVSPRYPIHYSEHIHSEINIFFLALMFYTVSCNPLMPSRIHNGGIAEVKSCIYSIQHCTFTIPMHPSFVQRSLNQIFLENQNKSFKEKINPL